MQAFKNATKIPKVLEMGATQLLCQGPYQGRETHPPEDLQTLLGDRQPPRGEASRGGGRG